MPKPGCKSIPNIKNRRSEFSQIQPEPPEKGGRDGARRIAEAKRRGRIFILDEKLPFRETETNKKTELGQAPSFCAKGLSFFAGGREKPAAIRENVSRQFFKRGHGEHIGEKSKRNLGRGASGKEKTRKKEAFGRRLAKKQGKGKNLSREPEWKEKQGAKEFFLRVVWKKRKARAGNASPRDIGKTRTGV